MKGSEPYTTVITGYKLNFVGLVITPTEMRIWCVVPAKSRLK